MFCIVLNSHNYFHIYFVFERTNELLTFSVLSLIDLVKKTYLAKNEKQKIPHCRTMPKSNIKIVERGKIDTTNTQIHDSS